MFTGIAGRIEGWVALVTASFGCLLAGYIMLSVWVHYFQKGIFRHEDIAGALFLSAFVVSGAYGCFGIARAIYFELYPPNTQNSKTMMKENVS